MLSFDREITTKISFLDFIQRSRYSNNVLHDWKIIIIRITAYLVSQFLFLINHIRWKKPAHPEKIIWISPEKIIRSIEFSKIVQHRRYYLNGVISAGEWGKGKYSIYQLHGELFKAFNQRFIHNISFSETEYFMNKEITENELKEEIKKYENKYGKIYKQINQKGFKIPDSIFDKISWFKISIASNGDLLFMTGKHRLAIAKVIGNKIPVKVSHRHKNWQKFRDKLHKKYTNGKISKKDIINFGHPDLFDLTKC